MESTQQAIAALVRRCRGTPAVTRSDTLGGFCPNASSLYAAAPIETLETPRSEQPLTFLTSYLCPASNPRLLRRRPTTRSFDLAICRACPRLRTWVVSAAAIANDATAGDIQAQPDALKSLPITTPSVY